MFYVKDFDEMLIKYMPSKYITLYYNYYYSKKHFLNRINDIIIDVILSIINDINDKSNIRSCFELLNFEFVIDEDLRIWLYNITNKVDLTEYNNEHSILLNNMIDELLNLTLFSYYNYKKENNKSKFNCIYSMNNDHPITHKYNLNRDINWYYPFGIPSDYNAYPEKREENEESFISVDSLVIKPSDIKKGNEGIDESNDDKKIDENNDDGSGDNNNNSNNNENNNSNNKKNNNKCKIKANNTSTSLFNKIKENAQNNIPIIEKKTIYDILTNEYVLELIIKEYNNTNNDYYYFLLLNISLEYTEFRYSILTNMKLLYNSIKHKIIDSVRKDYELYLWCNYIGDKGITFLSNSLKYIPKLEILNLESNEISIEGIKHLFNNMSNICSLKILDLQSITFIYLDNYIFDEGIKIISENLSSLTDLEVLYLSGNHISNNGIYYLSKQIHLLNNLVELHLSVNDIDENGFNYLFSILPKLPKLELLNISCII